MATLSPLGASSSSSPWSLSKRSAATPTQSPMRRRSVEKDEENDEKDENVGDLSEMISRFRRGARNVETLRQRLGRVARASDGLRDGLLSFSCGALEDAGGRPKKPSEMEISLVAADEHSILARVARASDAPYRELSRQAAAIEAAIVDRGRLVRDYGARRREMDEVNAKLTKARDPHSLDFEVAVRGTEYMRAADRSFNAARRLEVAFDAFEKALAAEERATTVAVAAARIAHAERASACLRPVVEHRLRDYQGGDDDAAALAQLLERCRRPPNAPSRSLYEDFLEDPPDDTEEMKERDDIFAGAVLPETLALRARVLDLGRPGPPTDLPGIFRQQQPGDDNDPLDAYLEDEEPTDGRRDAQTQTEERLPDETRRRVVESLALPPQRVAESAPDDDPLEQVRSAVESLSPATAAALQEKLEKLVDERGSPPKNESRQEDEEDSEDGRSASSRDETVIHCAERFLPGYSPSLEASLPVLHEADDEDDDQERPAPEEEEEEEEKEDKKKDVDDFGDLDEDSADEAQTLKSVDDDSTVDEDSPQDDDDDEVPRERQISWGGAEAPDDDDDENPPYSWREAVVQAPPGEHGPVETDDEDEDEIWSTDDSAAYTTEEDAP